MFIEKGKKKYTVTEYKSKWTVSEESGKLSVAYDVSKEICGTADELRAYVLNNNLF